ncbi:tRNA epoxyqueuosine(34) reductase QueG [Herbivorax sp. ANBcel31]|uniref:tRNA epoxyqueuosine(34) reductase QueG n=1 Tax=Herbivorax sp. ANBcel31 TaxID=3069754 RepID=UPI0027B492A1|nr:tRNA epoxyqueuosine(34) reductase QueG [Herbivorax sp. ANBcel31]MDQ2087871.1 tRNA epoxyqueuosine(34) reductase QueG [Herbivorax sp. ANBcel31]
MNVKEKIIEFSKSITIDDIGFCSAKPLFSLEKLLLNRKNNKNTTEFETPCIQKRLNPKNLMQSGKTVIIIIEKYPNYFKQIDDKNMRGTLSLCAIGEDYHIKVKNKLAKLCEMLEKNFNANSIMEVDTGPLLERALAVRANLGWIGKNNCFYSYKYGSFVFIGCIVTDMEFKVSDVESTKPLCSKCQKCIDNCPTNALSSNGINLKRCLAYNTVTKNNFNFDVLKNFGNNLYGCDICQLNCPYNSDIREYKTANIFEAEKINPKIEDILTMTKSQYQKKYKNTAIYWRGKNILKRNALIQVINSPDSEYKKNVIERILFKENNSYLKNFLFEALKKVDKE